VRFFDFFALSVLAVVPILWCRSRLPQANRNPPITERQAVRIGAVVSTLLCAVYIYRYVIYR
jgi:predicted MFS family arabinose efflux permease